MLDAGVPAPDEIGRGIDPALQVQIQTGSSVEELVTAISSNEADIVVPGAGLTADQCLDMIARVLASGQRVSLHLEPEAAAGRGFVDFVNGVLTGRAWHQWNWSAHQHRLSGRLHPVRHHPPGERGAPSVASGTTSSAAPDHLCVPRRLPTLPAPATDSMATFLAQPNADHGPDPRMDRLLTCRQKYETRRSNPPDAEMRPDRSSTSRLEGDE